MAEQRRIAVPVADLFDQPNGKRIRQFLFGEAFMVERIENGFAFGARASDGYAGVMSEASLLGWAEPTHRVRDLGAHIYVTPDIKGPAKAHLPYQSEITVIGEQGEFVEIAGGGYIHIMQIETVAQIEGDFARTAERYLGVPYLWGGNSQLGIDCSGLVASALRGAGIAHPADSSDQERILGTSLPDGANNLRGDLIFWKGHVGIMLSDTLILHANGYHMKCVFEPLTQASERIAQSGGGAITSRKRI